MKPTEHQRRLLEVVLTSIQKFRKGQIDIPGLQLNLTGIWGALEGDSPEHVREGIWMTEARLEGVRWTLLEPDQRAAAEEELLELEEIVNGYLTGE